MTKPLTSMAFNLDPRSMFCASPGRSLIRNQVFKMLSNKESLDQIIVATPGLSSDPIALGGFLFEGLSDDEDDFHPRARSTPSSSTPSSRPASLGYSGAAGPRPITQSELATALALASTPESSSHTPTPGTQGHSSGTSPLSSGVQSGTPITNDLFSQALQHALQASGQPNLQSQWQPQLQQLRDMGIQDDELSLRALQATAGDIQAALELIFAGGAP
ncbi:ubiquitin-like protein 7 isoform 10-T15 [Molossus nigricans]